MSRLKRKKEDREEPKLEQDIITKWSIPKILIALGVIALIGMAGVYLFDSISPQKENVLGTSQQLEDRAQIRIPSEKEVEKIVEQAKESVAGINTENIVESQPQIKKAIEDLEKLTTGDTNAKKTVCDAVCK